MSKYRQTVKKIVDNFLIKIKGQKFFRFFEENFKKAMKKGVKPHKKKKKKKKKTGKPQGKKSEEDNACRLVKRDQSRRLTVLVWEFERYIPMMTNVIVKELQEFLKKDNTVDESSVEEIEVEEKKYRSAYEKQKEFMQSLVSSFKIYDDIEESRSKTETKMEREDDSNGYEIDDEEQNLDEFILQRKLIEGRIAKIKRLKEKKEYQELNEMYKPLWRNLLGIARNRSNKCSGKEVDTVVSLLPDLLKIATHVFRSEKNVIVEPEFGPCFYVSDLRGHIGTLSNIFDTWGWPHEKKCKYVFLGDYIGTNDVDNIRTLLILLCVKLIVPENVILLRGTTESRPFVYCHAPLFQRELNSLNKKYPKLDIEDAFFNLFSSLPIAAVLNTTTIAVHLEGVIGCFFRTLRERTND